MSRLGFFFWYQGNGRLGRKENFRGGGGRRAFFYVDFRVIGGMGVRRGIFEYGVAIFIFIYISFILELTEKGRGWGLGQLFFFYFVVSGGGGG